MGLPKRSINSTTLGDVKRFRIGLCQDLSLKDYQTSATQNVTFKAGKDYIFDAKRKDFSLNGMEVVQNVENGIENDMSFTLKVYNDLLVSNFDPVWRKIEGRFLVIEVTTMNDIVSVFAPVGCKYNFSLAQLSEGSSYDFTFFKITDVNFADYILPTPLKNYIGDITSETIDGGVTYRLKVGSFVPGYISQYQAGYSLLPDITTINSWSSTIISGKLIIPNVPNNQKVYVFLKQIYNLDWDMEEHIVKILSYSVKSNMVTLEVNKPLATMLDEYDGSNVAVEDSAAGGTATASIIIVNQSLGSVITGTTSSGVNFVAPVLTGGETDTNNRTLLSIGVGISMFKNGNPLLVNQAFTKTDVITYSIAANVPTTSNYTLFSYRAIGTISGNSATSTISANVTKVTDNPNVAFEANTLKNVINATPDIAINRLDFDIFPDTPVQARANYEITLISADSVEYIDMGAPKLMSLGLATGFGHNKLRTTAEIPQSQRSLWNLYFGSYATGRTEAELYSLAQWEAQNKWNTNIDKNGQQVGVDISMIDIEEFSLDGGASGWTYSKLKAFMLGYQTKCLEINPNHIYVHYGMQIAGIPAWASGYGYDSDNVPEPMRWLPWVKPSYLAKYRNNSGLIKPDTANKNILFTIAPMYLNAPMPMTHTMYKKVGGDFVLNEFGDREEIDYEFVEEYRGISHHWNPILPGAEPTPEGWIYRRYHHEVFLSIWGIPMIYMQALYSLQMIANEIGLGHDVSNLHAVSPYKTVWIVRDDFESNNYQDTVRPYDSYSTKASTILAFVMAKNFYNWGGFTGTWGYTDNGSGILQAVNQGTNLNKPPGNTPPTFAYHNGKQRQSVGLSYYFKMLSRDYGFGSKTDKMLLFGDPEKFQSRAEMIAVGLLQGNAVYIAFIYTQHDIGESTQVTVANKKNNVAYSITVTAKEIFQEVFIFPNDTYETADITIKYVSIKGVTVHVTGNLMNHDA